MERCKIKPETLKNGKFLDNCSQLFTVNMRVKILIIGNTKYFPPLQIVYLITFLKKGRKEEEKHKNVYYNQILQTNF